MVDGYYRRVDNGRDQYRYIKLSMWECSKDITAQVTPQEQDMVAQVISMNVLRGAIDPMLFGVTNGAITESKAYY